jgi:hypothetical protein
LSRKSDVVKLALAGSDPHGRAVMSKQAGSEFEQEARSNHVGSGTPEAADCQAESGRQITADAGSPVLAERGRCLRRKPDAIKLALAGRKPQTQADMSRPAGADFIEEYRVSQVGSGSQAVLCLLYPT